MEKTSKLPTWNSELAGRMVFSPKRGEKASLGSKRVNLCFKYLAGTWHCETTHSQGIWESPQIAFFEKHSKPPCSIKAFPIQSLDLRPGPRGSGHPCWALGPTHLSLREEVTSFTTRICQRTWKPFPVGSQKPNKGSRNPLSGERNRLRKVHLTER